MGRNVAKPCAVTDLPVQSCPCESCAAIRATTTLSFRCAPDLIILLRAFWDSHGRELGCTRDAFLSYVVATAVEHYKEHGTCFPQDNQQTIGQLIDDVDQVQSDLDQLQIELDEVRARALSAQSKDGAPRPAGKDG